MDKTIINIIAFITVVITMIIIYVILRILPKYIRGNKNKTRWKQY